MPDFVGPDLLEQIRSASDIVDIINGYIPLKRSGGAFMALCPFHKEKTPSFTVTPHKQIFYCFGCHKGGDVFSFVQAYENITFVEAVRRLAERAKIPLKPAEGSADNQAGFLKEQLLQIHEEIAQRWHSMLLKEPAGQPAREYLERRQVPPEAVKLFRLGYAPDLWDDSVNWLKKKGYDLATGAKAGLITRREGQSDYYDRFRGRLIFPIANEQGRLIAFSGRLLSAEAQAAKYINSPETPIFTKSRVFFGLDKSKRALIEEQSAIVCEGQLDLITAFMAGFKNVVAPQGTAFTEEHGRILKRYVEEVILCFDSDSAGQSATVRALDALLASGLAIRVVTIPSPHDPDSFIKQMGAAAFKELIAKAEAFFDFYLNNLCLVNDAQTDQGKKRIANAMGEKIAKTGNSVWLDQYAQKTAIRLEVSPEAVRSEFKKAAAPSGPLSTADSSDTSPLQISPPSPAEFWVLKLLLLHEELAPFAAEHLQLEWIEHEGLREVLSQRLRAEQDRTWKGTAPFVGQFLKEEETSLASAAASESRPLPNPELQLRDCLRKLRDRFLEKEGTRLIQRASNPAITAGERLELLRRRQEILQVKSQPFASRT